MAGLRMCVLTQLLPLLAAGLFMSTILGSGADVSSVQTHGRLTVVSQCSECRSPKRLSSGVPQQFRHNRGHSKMVRATAAFSGISDHKRSCDPESHKTRDLERLIVGPQGGVANTVVFLKNISSGKAMEMPEPRRLLDQRHCRYEPHILLVPQGELLKMKSSDATLHTIHMNGAATYNLPFPFPNQVISRPMQRRAWLTSSAMAVTCG